MTLDDNKSIAELVDEIKADGKLSRAELKRLDRFLLADGKLCAEERQCLADLLAMIGRGELQVED